MHICTVWCGNVDNHVLYRILWVELQQITTMWSIENCIKFLIIWWPKIALIVINHQSIRLSTSAVQQFKASTHTFIDDRSLVVDESLSQIPKAILCSALLFLYTPTVIVLCGLIYQPNCLSENPFIFIPYLINETHSFLLFPLSDLQSWTTCFFF